SPNMYPDMCTTLLLTLLLLQGWSMGYITVLLSVLVWYSKCLRGEATFCLNFIAPFQPGVLVFA
ncbi:hypothetical protein XENOCAPTIV_015837, partial [Xenoophorus captivus]